MPNQHPRRRDHRRGRPLRRPDLLPSRGVEPRAGEAGRRLTLLSRHPQCAVLSTFAEDWTVLAAFSRALGRVDLAVALLEVTDRPAAYVLSGEPDAYGDDDMPVVGI